MGGDTASMAQRDALEALTLDDIDEVYAAGVASADTDIELRPTLGAIDAAVAAAMEEAREEVRAHGLEVPEVRTYYSGSERGVTSTEDGDVIVGRAGTTDRTYRLVDVMGHELIHQHVMQIKGAEEYTAREEAIAKVWDLYKMDMLGDRTACEEVLEEERELYNAYEPLADTFGDRLYTCATRFLDIMEKDMDGPYEERMEQLLQFYVEYY